MQDWPNRQAAEKVMWFVLRRRAATLLKMLLTKWDGLMASAAGPIDIAPILIRYSKKGPAAFVVFFSQSTLA